MSNRNVTDLIVAQLESAGFDAIERLVTIDNSSGKPVEKHSLVSRRGSGKGGLGFFAHSDTVPPSPACNQYTSFIKSGRLYGRGACDMKGPLAAALIASKLVSKASIRCPLCFIVTADEEIGFQGAKQVVQESQLLKFDWPNFGVVTEPTSLVPIHGQKGGCEIRVEATGVAAHTSTGNGDSATLRAAKFIGEMSDVHEAVMTQPQFLDHQFDPCHCGFNMVIDDSGTPPNVTSKKTIVTISFRPTPKMNTKALVEQIERRAAYYGLTATTRMHGPVFTPSASRFITRCQEITGHEPNTVSFGTDALIFTRHFPTEFIVLGPGSISQAHSSDEWISTHDLERAVDVYRDVIIAADKLTVEECKSGPAMICGA